MRVLLLASSMPPVVGGVERFGANLARGLRAAGCAVEVVTTIGSPLDVKFLKLLPLAVAAIRSCLRERPERVVAMVWTHEGIVALLLRALFGVQYAVVTHGSEILQYRHRAAYRRVMHAVLDRAQVIVANSRFTAERVVETGVPRDRLAVINPPVDVDTRAGGGDIDARFGLSGRVVMLTASRLVPRKGHASVIEALAALRDRCPSLVYVITGTGDYLPTLQQRARALGVGDRLIAAGVLTDAELAALFRRADIYLSASIEVDGDVEGFGMSLAEAGAFGLPVIAGRSGGVDDVVVDGETGVLVTPGDVDGLTAAVAALAENPAARQTLGARARTRIRDRFGIDDQGRRLAHCLAVAVPRPASLWPLLAALAVVGFVLSFPRAVLDYGQNGDALDNASDAIKLATGGFAAIPDMVRWPPGIPLFIALLAAVVPWAGHIGANLLVFAAYFAAVGLFAAIVRRETEQALLVALFATTPILVLNAAVAQDFMFGLAAALAAYLALTRRVYALAGLLLGIGMGFRVTNGLLLVPAAAYAFSREADGRRFRPIATMAVLTAAIGLLCYAPFIVTSGAGWRYFTPLPGHGAPFGHGWRTVLYNWLSIFGAAATLAILAVVGTRARHIARVAARDWRERQPAFLFALLTIGIFGLVSARFTMKPEYALPVIPFLYLLFARWFERRALVALTVMIASYAVVALDVKGGVSGRRELTLRPAVGILVGDWQRRREVRELRAGVAALAPLGRAVVLTGMAGVLTSGNPALEPVPAQAISSRLPAGAGVSEHRGVGTQVHRLRGTSVFVVPSLPREQVELVRRDGYQVLMFSEYAPSLAVGAHQYDPYAEGITPISAFGPGAFYRVGLSGRHS